MSMSPLHQPFHILRKDAIHLWPETLVSIALLAAFAWAEAQTWLPSDGGFNPASFGAGILKFLIVISWLILISRLVHDEELVGDRQFWTTRPYTWYSLLGAKVLYLAAFIGLPFLLMQVWLLHHAGLYPTLLLPALLKNLLYIACLFLLPLLALAAVTATFVRYISSVLGGFIYIFVVIAIAAYNWPESFAAPYLGTFISAALLALIVAALLVQYWRRKTLIARLLLAVAPLAVLFISLLAPVNLLSAHRYPDTSNATVSFDPNPMRQQPDGRLFNFKHQIAIDIPVQVQLTGLPEKGYLDMQSYRVVLDGPGGFHYTSDWSADRASFYPGQPAYVVPLELPEKVYNRIHDVPVALHLQLGTQSYHPGTEYSINATETPFPLPGHAACTVSADDGTLSCRFPYKNPAYIQVSATVHNGNCLTPGFLSAQAFGGLPPTLTPFGFSPVEIAQTGLSIRATKVPLCPGTRTAFTPAVEGGYGRVHLDIPAITLDPYARRIPVRPVGEPTPVPQAPQQ